MSACDTMRETEEVTHMSEYIYIDQNNSDTNGALGIIFSSHNIIPIDTGFEVHTENPGELLDEISRLCGLYFLTDGQELPFPLYGVPYLSVFAVDRHSGVFASCQDMDDGEVCYITPDLTVRRIADWFGALLDTAIRDPDWRQKLLPNGPWPRLPEAPAEREKLAETLKLPRPAPEKPARDVPPPRVFASRVEAEKTLEILDIWTVLRQKKEPRFQVHQMMSPQDRAGRAYVHYKAWHETYPGIMPEKILAAHTLERCQEIANKFRNDALVVLDRENNDRVVGFACYAHKAREFVSIPETAEITALYVLSEFQGLGLGRMLLESCLRLIYRDKVALFVLKGNERAVKFYEHMGFCLTGHEITDQRGEDTMTELEMVRDK